MSRLCTSCGRKETVNQYLDCEVCHMAMYCSSGCRTADRGRHHDVCELMLRSRWAIFADARTSPLPLGEHSRSPPRGLAQTNVNDPFRRLARGTWLTRVEPDVYRLLIDAYRLRESDKQRYAHAPGAFAAPVSGGAVAKGCEDGFRRFLDAAEARKNLLPVWWATEKRGACLDWARDAGQFHTLHRAVTAKDITDHYGDDSFPLQLRMIAEAITGDRPREWDNLEKGGREDSATSSTTM